MITKENFDELLQGLAEVLKSKNATIFVQGCEIEALKKKLAAAEREIHKMKGSKENE